MKQKIKKDGFPILLKMRATFMATILGLTLFTNTAGAEGGSSRFLLGKEIELVLTLPKNESEDYPIQPVEQIDDINDAERYDKFFKAIKVFDKYWDYKQFSFIGSVGTMRISSMIREFSESYNAPGNEFSGLRAEVEHRLSNDLLKAGVGKKMNSTKLVELTLNARGWIQYSADEADVYVTEIDKKHYLEIRFRFIDNSHGKKTDWRLRANSEKIKVMESVRLNRRP